MEVRRHGETRNGRERLSHIDGLRALAAGAVLLGHYFRAYGFPPLVPAGAWRTPLWGVQDGFAAVALFFVVSGFVLSLKYFEGQGERASLYIPKRLVRLGVPFLFALWTTSALHALVAQPYATVPAASPWILEFWTPSVGAAAQSFLFMQLGSPHRLLPQDWSLTVELNVSLWIPVLVTLASRNTVALAFAAIVSVALLGVHPLLLPFVGGVFLARFRTRVAAILCGHKAIVALTCVVGLLVYSSRGTMGGASIAGRVPDRGIWLLTDAGAMMIVTGVSASPWARRWLSSRVLTHLGRTSYSIFLWHFPVLMYGTPAALALLNTGIVDPTLVWYAGLITTIAGTWMVAELAYRFVEQPTIVLTRRMSDARLPAFRPWLGRRT